MSEEFGVFFRRDPHRLRVRNIVRADMGYLSLNLLVRAESHNRKDGGIYVHELKIMCSNAVEYYIRPKHPATIMGGPEIHFYEQHQLLDDRRLQGVPGGDGEVFNPPLKFQLLILDQTYVIAERFEVEEKSQKIL